MRVAFQTPIAVFVLGMAMFGSMFGCNKSNSPDTSDVNADEALKKAAARVTVYVPGMT
jgi:hypothetical protein